MHRTRPPLVLALLALLSPAARAGSATPPDPATAVVERQLVKPLGDKEARQSRFSRTYVPPQTRRVRLLETQAATDRLGAAFVPFAVDERSAAFVRRPANDASGWRKDAIVGCVYPARDEVFVKRGDKFFGATLLLGKRTPPADAALCVPATTRIAVTGGPAVPSPASAR